MTDYNDIPQADIDTDSPIDESLLERMRDNPIAITEGSSGAPKIQTAAIQDSAVTSPKISALAVITGKIADLAVTAGKIATGAVTNAKLAALAVTTDKISASAVTTAKINDLAVTSPKINNQAIKSNHLSIANVDLLVNKGTGGTATGQIAIPNSVYSLGVEIIATTAGITGTSTIAAVGAGGGIGVNSLNVEAAGGLFTTGSATGRAWYITASPPYKLNGMETNLFAYILEFNKPGDPEENAQIAEVFACESPPWISYPGFSILPDHYTHDTDPETGEEINLKCFKNLPVNKPEIGEPGYVEWMQNPEYLEQEITPEYKNTHLNNKPHPWSGLDMAQKVAAWLPEGEEMQEGETWQDYFTIKFLCPHCEQSNVLLNMLKDHADVTGFIYGGGIALGDKMEESLLPEIETYSFTFT